MPARWTLLLLTWLSGCTTTATITLVNGDRVDAKILGGDQDDVIVQTAAGTEVPLDRSEISDIDHPGNVAAVVGAIMTVNGAVNIVLLAPTCGDGKPTPDVSCVGAILHTTIGVSVLAWGLTAWWRSTHAAAPGSKASSADAVPEPPPSSAFDFSPSTAHTRPPSPGTELR